ncbi:LysM peptidoglycan-binding domain-containing protein [Peribacillus deserti]|uniref:LysM domain-containing protein n=1 Tax=Peribacillus deserti TaxID=673318 RepID=A0A2N5M064_9BACI|nr:LysM peptidoglycan-binding domain-containing protein [Peribacillus deserti]PLT27731.1 hypothetical protein CUU66_22335 [Peribacillus deserti]
MKISAGNILEAAIKFPLLRKIKSTWTIGTALLVLFGTILMSGGTLAGACSDTYTVKKGDTLLKLSAKYHVTVQQLKGANGLNSDKIYIGQRIDVPALHAQTPRKTKKPEAVTSPAVKSIKGQIYNVKAGDSVWAISKRFNVTVNALIQANGKKNTALRTGEKLIIPGEALLYKTAKVTGAADNHSIEFVSGKEYFVLQVGYGKAEGLVKQMKGKTLKVYYKGSQFISYKY